MSELKDTHLQDVGLCSESFYKASLNPLTYTIRSFLHPLINIELPLLQYIQSFHNNWLTNYFLYTANVGSHTFYNLMLPFLPWFGSVHLCRDLIIVLGLGIYFTGMVKDSLCLPRPHSPPLKRLTMSHYTSKEYGCPSSHSANATSVCIVLFLHIFDNSSINENFKTIIYFFLSLYWFTIIIGRMYCGMHGLLDISIGCIIGLLTVLLRYSTKSYYDYLCLSSSSPIYIPLIIISIYYSLIYFHPIPLEPCPCFEDSIAFIAVLLGLDLAYWSLSTSDAPLNTLYQIHNAKFNYNYNNLGFFGTLGRIIIGILLVLIWKLSAKPLFTNIIRYLRNEKPQQDKCYAYMSRYDTRIIVKFIVYSGIPIVVLYSKCVFTFLNL
jgi:sphingosine-1-phosphate phosphatase 1